MRKFLYVIIVLFLMSGQNTFSQAIKKPDYNYDGELWEGLQYVTMKTQTGFTVGFANAAGEIVIPLMYDLGTITYARFSEGLCPVKWNGKYGFIDRNNKIVVPFVYDYAAHFSEGLAPAGADNKYGFIDKTGNMVIQPVYTWTNPFYEGLAMVVSGSYSGYINSKGEVVLPLIYIQGGDFHEGFASVRFYGEDADNFKFIDKEGHLLPAAINYSAASEFYNGFAVIYEPNKKYPEAKAGIIDTKGNIIVPLMYDNIDTYRRHKDLFICKLKGKWGIINSKRKIIKPFIYNDFWALRQLEASL